jgi:hypothetical protein
LISIWSIGNCVRSFTVAEREKEGARVRELGLNIPHWLVFHRLLSIPLRSAALPRCIKYYSLPDGGRCRQYSCCRCHIFCRYDAKAIGSGSEGAQTSLQQEYHSSLTLAEAGGSYYFGCFVQSFSASSMCSTLLYVSAQLHRASSQHVPSRTCGLPLFYYFILSYVPA